MIYCNPCIDCTWGNIEMLDLWVHPYSKILLDMENSPIRDVNRDLILLIVIYCFSFKINLGRNCIDIKAPHWVYPSSLDWGHDLQLNIHEGPVTVCKTIWSKLHDSPEWWIMAELLWNKLHNAYLTFQSTKLMCMLEIREQSRMWDFCGCGEYPRLVLALLWVPYIKDLCRFSPQFIVFWFSHDHILHVEPPYEVIYSIIQWENLEIHSSLEMLICSEILLSDAIFAAPHNLLLIGQKNSYE